MNNDDFTALAPESADGEEPCEDNTEMLLKKYEHKRSQKTDDIFAVQTLLCVLLAGAFFVGNIFYPEVCSALLEQLKTLISDKKEIMPNPIDYLLRR